MAELDEVNDSDSDIFETDQLSPAAEILVKISQWILDGSDGSFEDLVTDLSVNQLLQEAVMGDTDIIGTSEMLVDVMKFLICRGANVNYQDLTDPYLRTILHLAVRNRLVSEAELLIKIGANVNALCIEPYTALPQGPDDPNFPEGFLVPVQTSCLMMAIENGDLDMTELLLSHDADLSHAVRHGALNYRAEEADLPFLKYLINHGADVGQVLDETDEQRPMLLVDKLFQKACNKERLLRSIMAPSATDCFLFRRVEFHLTEHERFLDCLKFVLSEKAPTMTKDGLSCFSTLNDAFRDECFLTICRLYFYCVTNAIPIVLPDALPQMNESELSIFVPSGSLILAKMLRTWPPVGEKVSNNLMAGLETFAGMLPENPGAPTLKILCMLRIRLGLHKSTVNFQCLNRLKELGLPPSLQAAVTLKHLIHQLEHETRMALEPQELCRLSGLIFDHLTPFADLAWRCVNYLASRKDYVSKLLSIVSEIQSEENVFVASLGQLELLLLNPVGDLNQQFDSGLTAQEFTAKFQEPSDGMLNAVSPLVARFKELCEILKERQPALVNAHSILLKTYRLCQFINSTTNVAHEHQLLQIVSVDEFYDTSIKSIPEISENEIEAALEKL